jgi:hypothetical protein
VSFTTTGSPGDWKLRLDVVELHDAVDLADVEGAIAERDAARLVQPLGNRDDLIGLVVAVLIDDGVDRVAGGLVAAADEDGALAAEGHLAGVGDAGGKSSILNPGAILIWSSGRPGGGAGLRPHACRGRRGLYPGNPDSGDRQGQGEGGEGRFAHPEMVIRRFLSANRAGAIFLPVCYFFSTFRRGPPSKFACRSHW